MPVFHYICTHDYKQNLNTWGTLFIYFFCLRVGRLPIAEPLELLFRPVR